MSMTSSDLELVTDGTNVQVVGLRFLGIDIPPGAVITSAYIQFQTDEVSTGASSLLIRGEDTGDAAAFTTTAFNASSRVTTDASVAWTPTDWTTVGEAGLGQRTPDMTAVVQEIVSRSDWAALNDMVFLITGSGRRTAEAFESGTATAPLLHIEYTSGSPVAGSVSINDVSVTEGNSGTKLATFTVSRTGGTAPFSVDYATANGSATAGSDYVAVPTTTLSFAQGETSKTISVTINGDTTAESNENFNVNLSNAVGSGATIADGTGVGTILDDDVAATVGNISIDDVTVTEGNSGTKLATFTVSRTGTAAFSVDYATANGSATAGSDYVAVPSTTLNFAAGETSKTLSVTINGDTAVEGNETFNVNLSNAVGPGANIIDGTGLGTIQNDDSATGTAVNVRIASGTDDVEQRASSGSMSMTSSDLELVTDGTNVQVVGLRFLGIDIPPGAVITSAYIQFQTDEVSTGASSLLIRGEDTGDAAAFTTTAFNASSRVTTDASVAWTPTDWTTVGEAGLGQRTPDMTAVVQEIVSRSDWAALNDMVFLITGSGRRTAEAFESGTATAPLLHIEYTSGSPVAGSVSINDVSVTEGNSGTKLATFTVSRTGGTAPFSVDYATANGSATAGSDYVAVPTTTLSFAQGETSKTISVTINGDTTAESNENFNVNLSNAVGSGATIADGTGVGTILDDDVAATVGNISIDDVTVTEGNSGTKLATFTVSRTGTAAFSVDYATANGSATAGSDYVAVPSTTLNFAAGETSKTLSVTINGDTAVEGNETFNVNLSNAVGPGATISDGTGVGTILNDDGALIQATVRNVWDTTLLGSPWGSGDPSGLAYVPGKGLFLCDSEADESPYHSSNNMFLVQPNDGGALTRIGSPINLTSFTIEPTGLAYAPTTDLLYISDDDADRIFWVDPDNPQVRLGSFSTTAFGNNDSEDVAYDGFDGDVNGGDGHLYVANGQYGNIKECTTSGTLVRTISLPSAVSDPEALLWDDVHNLFFIGGKFSSNIWVLDRNGGLVQTITLLGNYDRAGSGVGVKVTDFALAPSSDPNDDPAKLSLYVADYGADQVNDGRLFEIDLGPNFFP